VQSLVHNSASRWRHCLTIEQQFFIVLLVDVAADVYCISGDSFDEHV